jgi:hypothetical protein
VNVDIRDLLRDKADEALDASHAVPPSTLSRARRRRVVTALAASVTAAAVVVGGFAGVNALRQDATPPVSDGPRLVLSKSVRLEGAARDLVLGEGSVWVQADGPQPSTLVRIDPRTSRIVATITPGYVPSARPGEAPTVKPSIAGGVTALTVGEGAVWALGLPIDTGPRSVSGPGQVTETVQRTLGPEPGATARTFSGQAQPIDSPTPAYTAPNPQPDQRWTVLRIDPRSNEVREGQQVDGVWRPEDAAAGVGALWVVGGFGDTGTLYRIDPNTLRPVNEIPIGGFPNQVAVAAGSVWVGVTGSGRDMNSVLRVDPDTNAVVSRIPMPMVGPLRLVVDGGVGWATVFEDLRGSEPVSLVRVDLDGGHVVSVIPTRSHAGRLVAGLGHVWLADGRRSLAVFDGESGAPMRDVQTRGDVISFAVGGGSLWTIDGVDGMTVSRYDVVE